MGSKSNINRMIILQMHVIFALSLTLLFELCLGQTKKIPASFVFGDSLVEAGNNNYIVSFSKANYVPNGIDFGKPTGRFTNGRTIVDIIGQEVGFKDFTPPYLAPTTKGQVVLKGVNYASGAGGILNKTGIAFGGRINMDAQLDNFANTREFIISSLGEKLGIEILKKSLYSVTMGSNDFINNYLTPVLSAAERKLISPEQFVASMIPRYRLQLTRLYNMGARKIVVVNVGPIGCIPFQRDTNPLAGTSCVELPNYMAKLFNAQLKIVVSQLSTNLKGSTFLYADVYYVVQDLINNYKSYGFENSDSSCCYVGGRHGGLIPCGPLSRVCTDRSKYVFWDPYHPSDSANVFIANRLVNGDSRNIWPMNIRQLAQLS